MKTELLNEFQGKHNVRHIINDDGAESWLTQEISFGDETFLKGACKLNTVENETKHVLFLFNGDDEEVGRYYLGKKLQGKTPAELVGMKHDLVFFESFNSETKSWVPCIGINNKKHFDQLLKTGAQNQAPPFPPDQKEGPQNASFDNKTKFEYTEEMFNQEIADQEERDLLEYGTTDEKKIEQNKEARKRDRNAAFKAGCTIVIILWILFMLIPSLIAKCTGSKFDTFEDNDTEWQYKHSDRHY